MQVTAADIYDPSRVIQELRRTCEELGALGDVVVPARKTHAFVRALPDEKYGSLKTVLLCGRQRDGSSSAFEDIAARATSYHAMQIRDKITAKDERAGGENDAGSHETAMNTTVHEEPLNSRSMVEVKDEDTAEIVTRTNNPVRCNNNNGGYTSTNSNGNSYDTSNAGGTEDASERSHTNQTSGRGGRQRGRNVGKNRHGRCSYCCNSTERGWHDCPLRLSHQQSDDTQHANAVLVGATEGNMFHAWCTQVAITENADLESVQVVVGEGAEYSPNHDQIREDGTNTQVQEDIAFPAMMDIGTCTPPGDAAVFMDTAVASYAARRIAALPTCGEQNRLQRACQRIMRPL